MTEQFFELAYQVIHSTPSYRNPFPYHLSIPAGDDPVCQLLAQMKSIGFKIDFEEHPTATTSRVILLDATNRSGDRMLGLVWLTPKELLR